MTCELYEEALLDETAARPAGLQAHLTACAACRELAGAHARAQAIPRGPPALPHKPVLLAEVMRRVRRRRAVARAGALAGIAAAALLAWPPARGPDGRTEVFAGVRSVTALAAEVAGYARQDPVLADRTYAAFGGLALWVAPPGRPSARTPERTDVRPVSRISTEEEALQ